MLNAVYRRKSLFERRLVGRPAIWLVMLMVLVLGVITTPINHDESQYVAGAILALSGSPFKDFLILQPPLTFWVWLPFVSAAPHWALTALRISSAMFGGLTIWLVHRAERALGVPFRRAIGAPLMICSQTFLFTSAVARNDALPCALLAIGMVAGVLGIDGRRGWLAVAGLGFGLAGAAKLSFLPSLAAAVFILPACGVGFSGVLVFGAGALLASTVLFTDAFLWPEAYRFGLIDFAVSGPFDWYRHVGLGANLTLTAKFKDTALALADGPALAALLLVAWRVRRWPRKPADLFLLALIIGGLIGALLPTPTHRQYLLPLLPPLFAITSRVISNWVHQRAARRTLAVFALVGIVGSLASVIGGPRLIEVEEQSHAIGSIMARANVHGAIASLSPQLVADSGEPIDSRFATGPFVFRTGATLDPSMAWRIGTAIPSTLDAMLDMHPPAAVLTGYEGSWHTGIEPLDAPLDRWATGRGYKLVKLSDNVGRLYLREPYIDRFRFAAPGRSGADCLGIEQCGMWLRGRHSRLSQGPGRPLSGLYAGWRASGSLGT